jgi:hypothetical protein
MSNCSDSHSFAYLYSGLSRTEEEKTMYKFGMVSVFMFILVPVSAIPANMNQTGSNSLERLVQRLESNMDRFKKSADRAMDRSSVDGSRLEDRVNSLISEIELATDRLERRVDDQPIASDAVDVLGSALPLHMFMLRNRLTPRAQSDWARVKQSLEQLARHFNVAWVWSVNNNPALSKSTRRQIVDRIERQADQFRESFDDALDQSRVDGKQFEDHMNRVVSTFEESLDNLERQVDQSNELKEKDVLIVMNNALAIDDYFRRYKLTPRAVRDWARVKSGLDDLALMSNVTWAWVAKPENSAITATDANKPLNR